MFFSSPNSDEVLFALKHKLQRLKTQLIAKFPNDRRVKLLKERFNVDNVYESLPETNRTSFTVNKGSEIHLCLRDKESGKTHDINLLMFVALHELTHVISESWGHNEEFSENFVWLLNQAVFFNEYVPHNYNNDPQPFCGISVSHSPLF